ncbi:hypothetical protein [Novosphingobium lindaniclasticum]|uniref:hypothetical protein n=1 Tax=Novosphingobium lindaniclasticum TaxID=1329895 RepID=UPI0004248951|nr:hypothetical protein [Novosphingobium lindaniclasticum]
MSLKDMLRDHLLPAVATAAVLGGGASIIQTKVDVAKHDERISRIEKLDATMDKLTGELAETRETLARVEARQERQP